MKNACKMLVKKREEETNEKTSAQMRGQCSNGFKETGRQASCASGEVLVTNLFCSKELDGSQEDMIFIEQPGR